MHGEVPISSLLNCSDMEIACLPSPILTFESIFCSIMKAFVMETAKIAARFLFGLIYVHESTSETNGIQDSFPFKLIGKGKKAKGENVYDGDIDDGAGRSQCECDDGANGENGNTFGGEWHGSDEGMIMKLMKMMLETKEEKMMMMMTSTMMKRMLMKNLKRKMKKMRRSNPLLPVVILHQVLKRTWMMIPCWVMRGKFMLQIFFLCLDTNMKRLGPCLLMSLVKRKYQYSSMKLGGWDMISQSNCVY